MGWPYARSNLVLVMMKTPCSGIFQFLLEINIFFVHNMAVFVAALIKGEPWTCLQAFLMFQSPN